MISFRMDKIDKCDLCEKKAEYVSTYKGFLKSIRLYICEDCRKKHFDLLRRGYIPSPKSK